MLSYAAEYGRIERAEDEVWEPDTRSMWMRVRRSSERRIEAKGSTMGSRSREKLEKEKRHAAKDPEFPSASGRRVPPKASKKAKQASTRAKAKAEMRVRKRAKVKGRLWPV